MVSRASGERGTRLTRRLPAAVAVPGVDAGIVPVGGIGVEAMLVCVEAIVRCELSWFRLAVAQG